MDRRAFLGALGLLAGPLAVGAQPVPRVYRIGVLASTPPSAPPDPLFFEVFLGRLREFGYISGQNLAVEHRSSEGRNDRYAALAMELVR